MAYTMILLFLFWIILIIKKPKNRYTWLFGLLIIGINALILSLLITAAKIGNYFSPVISNRIFYDYKLYHYIAQITMPYQLIFTIASISAALFLFSGVIFSLEYLAQLYNWKASKTLRYGLLLAAYPLLHIFVFSFWVRYKVYLWYFTSEQSSRQLIYTLIYCGHLLQTAFLIFYLVFPAFSFCKAYQKAPTFYTQHKTLMLGVSFLVLEIVFVILYFGGPIQRFFSDSKSLQAVLLNHAWKADNPYVFYRVMPIVVITAMLTMLITLLFLGGLDSFTSGIPKYVVRRNLKYNNNLRGIFHSFKNILFSYSTVLSDIKESCADPGMDGKIALLDRLNNENIENIARALDSLRLPKQLQRTTDPYAAIGYARKKVKILPGIELLTLKESGDCRVFFSEYQLVEILVNLIQNAQEAIVEAGRSDGRIAVEMFRDDNAVIIRISDNGAGIPRKEERRIFEAFYSTKKIGKNWGAWPELRGSRRCRARGIDPLEEQTGQRYGFRAGHAYGG